MAEALEDLNLHAIGQPPGAVGEVAPLMTTAVGMHFADGLHRPVPAVREAILQAARARFGAEDYDRATVRAIAADAGIDPSMVMRYFGSKRQLFAVAADFDLRLPDLAGTPHEEVGSVLATHLFARWEHDDGLKILLRTAVTDDEAASRMRTTFIEQLTPMIAALADDQAARALAPGWRPPRPSA